MKADIHPNYHEINVVMTDGTAFKTRSAMGKPGDTIKLDIDPLSHPAWQGGTVKVIEKAQLKKFTNRYGSLFGAAPGEEEKKDEEKK